MKNIKSMKFCFIYAIIAFSSLNLNAQKLSNDLTWSELKAQQTAERNNLIIMQKDTLDFLLETQKAIIGRFAGGEINTSEMLQTFKAEKMELIKTFSDERIKLAQIHADERKNFNSRNRIP